MYSLARHTFWFFGVILTVVSMALVGCGSKDSGAPAPVAVVNPVIPLGTTPTTPTTGSGVYLAQSLQIIDKTTFELFLQNAQLCSPRIVGWSIGAANCESYSGAAWLGFQANGGGIGVIPTSVAVEIGAGASSPWDYNHSGWTTEVKRPSFALTNLNFAGNNSGFTGTGYYGFRMTTTGFAGTNAAIAVELIYNNITFARGTAYPR